jgi:hypothetical protein
MRGAIRLFGALAVLGFAFLTTPVFANNQQDTSPPVISNIMASSSDTSATVQWQTDEPATTQVEYGVSTFYGASTTQDSTLVTSHTQTLFGLTPNTLYHFRVWSIDSSNNTATSSDQTFVTMQTATSTGSTTDMTPPVISGINVTASTTTATITWATDEAATSQLMWGLTSSYTSSTTPDLNLVTGHSISVSGLTPNTLYHFEVLSKDSSNNTASSSDQTFTTASNATSTGTTTQNAPVISNIGSTVTQTGATVTWNTNIGASSQVFYGLNTNYGQMTTLDTGSTTNHSQNISGLNSGTLYHFIVLSSANGMTASSTDQTFTTQASSTNNGGGGNNDQIQNLINILNGLINFLEQQVTNLQNLLNNGGNNNNGGGNDNGGGTGTTTPSGTAMIDFNNKTARAGTTVDWGGRNFCPEEDVTVQVGSTTVETAHADNGGNFSTGSLPVPNTPNTTETFNFRGARCGDTATATLNITP